MVTKALCVNSTVATVRCSIHHSLFSRRVNRACNVDGVVLMLPPVLLIFIAHGSFNSIYWTSSFNKLVYCVWHNQWEQCTPDVGQWNESCSCS